MWVGRAFFIWTSVFNLFVVSVFWAFMVDVFTTEQGKRLFGFIAAAATIGGIVGASITASTVQSVGVPVLLLVSAVLLEVGVQASRRLGALNAAFNRPAGREDAAPEPGAGKGSQNPIGGNVFAGLTNSLSSPYLLNIAIYMLLYTRALDVPLLPAGRDRRPHLRRPRSADRVLRAGRPAGEHAHAGLSVLPDRPCDEDAPASRLTLMFVPAITAVGFLLLGIMPTVAIVVGFTVLRRAGNFAFARPTREVLFTVVSREDKYKAKNFIDTVVYRLGDQVGAWASSLISMGGFGPGAIAWAAVPLGLAWVANAGWLGRRQEQISAGGTKPPRRGAAPRRSRPPRRHDRAPDRVRGGLRVQLHTS